MQFKGVALPHVRAIRPGTIAVIAHAHSQVETIARPGRLEITGDIIGATVVVATLHHDAKRRPVATPVVEGAIQAGGRAWAGGESPIALRPPAHNRGDAGERWRRQRGGNSQGGGGGIIGWQSCCRTRRQGDRGGDTGWRRTGRASQVAPSAIDADHHQQRFPLWRTSVVVEIVLAKFHIATLQNKAAVKGLDHSAEAALLVSGPAKALEEIVANGPGIAKAALRRAQTGGRVAARGGRLAVPPFIDRGPAAIIEESKGAIGVVTPEHGSPFKCLPRRPNQRGIGHGTA